VSARRGTAVLERGRGFSRDPSTFPTFTTARQHHSTDLRELNELNLARFDAKLEQRIAEVKADLRQEIAALRTELRMDMADLRTEMAKPPSRQVDVEGIGV